MRKINAADKPQKLQTSKQREADRSASCQLAMSVCFKREQTSIDIQPDCQQTPLRR